MANRVDWYYRQLVGEQDMDGADDRFEQADWNIIADHTLHGIVQGLAIQQQDVPNLTVKVTGPGIAYDQTGKRIYVAANQNLDVSTDSNAVSTTVVGVGNKRIISVFIKFKRVLSNLKKDGNDLDVYYNVDESFEFIVEQSEEGLNPAPPALKADAKLLGDITRLFGGTTITQAAISIERTQYVFDVTAGGMRVVAGTAEEAIEAMLDTLAHHIADAGAHPATAIEYGGGPAWADGDTNLGGTLEATLDGIFTDLGGTAGAGKIGSALKDAGGGFSLTAGTVGTQLLSGITQLKDHVTDPTAAHAASAISNTPSLNLSSTNVQAALNELNVEKGGLLLDNTWTGAVNTFNNDIQVLGDTYAQGELQVNGQLKVNGGAYVFSGADPITSQNSDWNFTLGTTLNFTDSTTSFNFSGGAFNIAMNNSGAGPAMKTHTGTADELLADVRFYTACDTFTGQTSDTLWSTTLLNGYNYMITTDLMAISHPTPQGNTYARRSTTWMYATGGLITIPGGTGNVLNGLVNANADIISANTGWSSSGLTLNFVVNHAGSPQNCRCVLFVTVVRTKAT